jgi:hypothetical protein
MKWVTQQDVRAIIPKWSPEKGASVIGDGLSLREFVEHPEVSEDEALVTAFSSGSVGVSSQVNMGFLICIVARVVPLLETSELKEVRDFYQRWAESLPAIPEKGKKVSQEFEEATSYVSRVAFHEGDWLSHLALQIISQAYSTYLSYMYVRSVMALSRLLYTGIPGGWVTERHLQYEDLVRLLSEMGDIH